MMKPKPKSLADVEKDPDSMPLGGELEQLYLDRYAGKVSEKDFWAKYKELYAAAKGNV